MLYEPLNWAKARAQTEKESADLTCCEKVAQLITYLPASIENHRLKSFNNKSSSTLIAGLSRVEHGVLI